MTSSDSDVHTRTQQSPLASQRAKENGAPKGDGTMPRHSGYFPLGYKEGFSQWWASISPAAAEHKVMSFIPYIQEPPTHTETGLVADASVMRVHDEPDRKASPVTSSAKQDPYGPRRWHSNLVKLSGKNRALNEFSVERVGEDVKDHMVILHGYGAGLGFFYKNFEALSRPNGWKLWALDLLGMGRSSRPPFAIHSKDPKGKIEETESWFVDALEEWRVQKKIDKFTLCGHSLGGYMSVAYALKYPGHLKKLILVSPVGIPEDPYAAKSAMLEPGESTMVNEFTQDQGETTASKTTTDNNNFLNARNRAEKAAGTTSSAALPPRKPYPKWFTYLWEANLSPFSVVRWGGPLGPRFVSGWTSRRFSHLPLEESQALHDYSYSLFRQRGSGEFALAYILAPGAFARSPLIRRIQGVGRQPLPGPNASTGDSSSSSTVDGFTMVSKPDVPLKTLKEAGIPVVFFYGENDWMDVAGGFAAVEKLKAEKAKALAKASTEEAKRERGDSRLYIVKKAGHHVYLDGWEDFNDLMIKEMEGKPSADTR